MISLPNIISRQEEVLGDPSAKPAIGHLKRRNMKVMFTEKDVKRQSATLASMSKYRGKDPSNLRRTTQPLNSLQTWQRSLGNQYLNTFVEVQGNELIAPRSSLLGRMNIQAKLTIGEPNDAYEQEADRVARRVVDEINAPASAQSETEEEELQMKPQCDRYLVGCVNEM